MSSSSDDTEGCAALVGAVFLLMVVGAVVKAIVEAVSDFVKAVVGFVVAVLTLLAQAVLVSFPAAATLAMAWFLVVKVEDEDSLFALNGRHAAVLAATGVAVLGLQGLLLFEEFASFEATTNLLVLATNSLVVLPVAFAPTFGILKRSLDAKRAARRAAEAREQERQAEAAAEQQRQEQQERDDKQRAFLQVAEIQQLISGVEGERAKLQAKVQSAHKQIASNQGDIERLSQKANRAQTIAALREDNANLERFLVLTQSIDEALAARITLYKGQRHFLKTLRSLPALSSFPTLDAIIDGEPSPEVEGALAKAIEEMQTALRTLEERLREYTSDGHVPLYKVDYEKLIAGYDKARDDAIGLLSRVRSYLIIPRSGGKATDGGPLLLGVDDEINETFEELRQLMDGQLRTGAMAELLDVSGELALLEAVNSKTRSGNANMEEMTALLGTLRQRP